MGLKPNNVVKYTSKETEFTKFLDTLITRCKFSRKEPYYGRILRNMFTGKEVYVVGVFMPIAKDIVINKVGLGYSATLDDKRIVGFSKQYPLSATLVQPKDSQGRLEDKCVMLNYEGGGTDELMMLYYKEGSFYLQEINSFSNSIDISNHSDAKYIIDGSYYYGSNTNIMTKKYNHA